ncbi:MAG: DNA polymerase III subunit alpha [Woeseiaceae bacterium]|nr:DNA polymerase III subunit alpha [Woeseiaceae bacterium]NIP19712.1 DNA polymerase III subunit alpha [Woeseiaceae bacterium]NIS89829.1 DNA polymerase III subunit alpha [Woeseiaceae bacterium]
MSTAPFVHLHLHTEYSLVDSTVRISQLMQRAADDGMAAIALTDLNNLFGMVKFYRAAVAAGIKPIIGADIRVANEDDESRPWHLVLLCQGETGYRNLSRLLTRAYLEGQRRGVPLVQREWLTSSSCENLIALSGGLHGDVGHALHNGHYDLAQTLLDSWLQLFGDRYYLELVRTGRSGEEDCVQASLTLASDTRTPVVATNDVRFLARDDYNAHEARVCIHEGRTLADPDRPNHYSKEQYLRSSEEMAELFADIPAALENATEIARRCTLELTLGESVLPAFPVPDGQTEAAYLEEQARAGLERQLQRIFKTRELADKERAAFSAPYFERLRTELDVISGMGFPGYFLIVADFIRWARDNNIPVGPGRGSGAGSLVAWVLGITDLDPLEHDLLFERFLNPERVSMPDFDIDFCMEGRDNVIDYVAERYGRDRVAQIITFGTMAARAVIRDTGRVLGHPYGFVDRIAKQVPFEIGMTLDKALDQSDELSAMYRDDEEVAAIIDLAKSLEGLARNAGKHAGGVVIAPTALTNFTPLYCEDGGTQIITQLDKDDVEAIGLVKFDFLGLKTLTIIDWAGKIVNESQPGAGFDISSIPDRDPKTFELLRSTATAAVFQLESSGMRDLIKRMRPDRFDDLVALVALFRPGPLQSGMVDDFIAHRHAVNKDDIDYLHPDLKPLLEETYGVILYQEQVMQIAQVLAGYTLGGADLLRRAMGKKKPEEMATQREIFVGGATERGVAERTATRIFDLMEKFAGYGFNKSHSAAYAVLAYQTAYLKAHYPAAFMAAVMTADLDNTDRLVTLKDDCRKQGLRIIPPNVNGSAYAFSVADESTILYGLGAIKGVGRSVVDAIIVERQANGPYSDLSEFCRRVEHDKINRRAIEAMIKAGAMGDFGLTRRALIGQVPQAVASADQVARAAAAGQNDMFGLGPVAAPVESPKVINRPEWPEQEFLRYEKEALGLYLTGHPFNAVRADAMAFVDGKLADILSEPPPQSTRGENSYAQAQREVTVAGLVADIRKRGNRVSVVLDDDTGRMEMSLFSEAFQEFRHLLVKDEVVVVSGGLRYDDFLSNWTVTAKQVSHIDRVIEARAKGIVLNLRPYGQGEALLVKLHDVLLPYRKGNCDISVQYIGDSASAQLKLGPEWTVRPSRELRDKLSELLGSKNVRMLYAPGREIR